MNRSPWFARRAVAALALGAALALVPMAASPAVAHDGGQPFVTVLTGQNEVPAGDPDGIGLAVLTVNAGQGKICYLLVVDRLDGTVTAAHVHRAPAGMNGPVVVPLTAPVSGVSAACAMVDHALAADVVRNPANYYINIHTSAFPDGAVRGQLR